MLYMKTRKQESGLKFPKPRENVKSQCKHNSLSSNRHHTNSGAKTITPSAVSGRIFVKIAPTGFGNCRLFFHVLSLCTALACVAEGSRRRLLQPTTTTAAAETPLPCSPRVSALALLRLRMRARRCSRDGFDLGNYAELERKGNKLL